MIRCFLITILLFSIATSTFAQTGKPIYLALVGDSITVGVDGNATQPLETYPYDKAIIDGKPQTNYAYHAVSPNGTVFAPGGYREAMVQILCGATFSGMPKNTIASHFHCDAAQHTLNYMDAAGQAHPIYFLGNTRPNPNGGYANNDAPGLTAFTYGQDGKTVAPYYANQGYTLCDSAQGCYLPISSLFSQPHMTVPKDAHIITVVMAGTNDILLGLDSFDQLKADLAFLITNTLPTYLNPNDNDNYLTTLVLPITPVAASGSCKMLYQGQCADVAYNAYIQKDLVSDIHKTHPDSSVQIVPETMKVEGYNHNVHPDLQNYAALGYNVAAALTKQLTQEA